MRNVFRRCIRVQSLLVGNGIDIQIGGMDFHNKWIIVRLLADAKAGKFVDLFKSPTSDIPAISADDLVELFLSMPTISNKVRNGEYDCLINETEEPEIYEALISFKSRYADEIRSAEEIGLEDWLFLLRVFLQEQSDLLPLYETAKQGFERVVLDAIYCNGVAQKLHKNISKKAKEYFGGFDNVFTINYDNALEKATGREVFHLHGNFETKAISESPDTAYGYLRQQTGETVYFPPQFQHCNCNAILNYSGDGKYKFATALSNALSEFERLKVLFKKNRKEAETIISKFPAEQQDIIRFGLEENLQFGYNYHFNKLEQLTGELAIIGIAPQNDSHLFDCINRSNLDKVIFYHFYPCEGAPDPILLLTKPYEIKKVSELWENINLQTPSYRSKTVQTFSMNALKDRAKTQDFVDAINAMTGGVAFSLENIQKQLKTIPEQTEKAIIEMMIAEIKKDEYHTKPTSEQELTAHFREFGKTLEVSSLSPQTLYFLYISNIPRPLRHAPAKKAKRKKKRNK